MNSLPVPVAFVVVANEPTGAVVVVELAVIADVRKYKPAVALATTAPVVADEVNVLPLIVAPVMVVPLTSSGSEKATPTGLVLGIAFSPNVTSDTPSR